MKVQLEMKSEYIDDRDVVVWLPGVYSEGNPLPVLYMHDGDMLFDSAQTWNGQTWGVDGHINRLVESGTIRPCIVVAIPNGGAKRHSEFFPRKAFDKLEPELKDSLLNKVMRYDNKMFATDIISDNYLKFLTKELKPVIDTNFAVKGDRDNTFIMGSSMGGLISMYAICEYPEVFGAAACLSTHWPVIYTNVNNPIAPAIKAYVQEKAPNPKTHRLYFDHGTATLDSLYPQHQVEITEILKSAGYDSENLNVFSFEGANHSENAWSERLHIPLEFLLGRNR
jgi:enterochelin esterase-like enzyme